MIDQRTGKPRLRAAALPPGERRAALIDSTVPLLVAHGTAISTQQIAEAAGVAEGTIFRVFPDKESLIAAAIQQVFDPAATDARLRAIDPALPLDRRLEAAVAILQRRYVDIGRLMVAVGRTKIPGARWGDGDRHSPPRLDALAEVLEPDRALLRRDPLQAAQLLRNLTFAGTHPALAIGATLSSAEIVSVILDGIRIRPEQASRPGEPC
ncbi:MAG: TetR/AcrR family transcriptional regulator [Acidimicrobiales bacterium]